MTFAQLEMIPGLILLDNDSNPRPSLLGLSAPMILYLQTAAAYMGYVHGRALVVTSGSESETTHSVGSFHYGGNAADTRTRHLAGHEAERMAQDLSLAMGPDFDIVFEVDHLHGEYQPKRRHG